MNDFLYGPQNINDFIEFHNAHHVYYCEIIIHPNGDAEYCIPSHQEKLLQVCKMTKEEFGKRIFSCDEIMIELCNESKCIAVWYNLYVNPNKITKEQYESLKLLKDKGCISSNLQLNTDVGYHVDKM